MTAAGVNVPVRSERLGIGPSLSPRELEVLRVLTTANRQEAAEQLGITPATIHWHLDQIYSKTYTKGLVQTYSALGWLRVPHG